MNQQASKVQGISVNPAASADGAEVKVLFSDFFNIQPEVLEEYGAFNISLIGDLPLFIDPFLLFGSENPVYKQLHEGIISYLKFLRDNSHGGNPKGLIRAWYTFREVRQNWLGFSISGNGGSGLGDDFAKALNANFTRLFQDFGEEQITLSPHLEKLCLVSEGVGKDSISDFTTNLIKDYLAEYTQEFAKKHIDPSLCKYSWVERAYFDYRLKSWQRKRYYLPEYEGDYVLLTPKDLLTKEESWINATDLYYDFDHLPNAIENEQLRAQINEYVRSRLSERETTTKKEKAIIVREAINRFPQLVDTYIRRKEDRADEAMRVSRLHVANSENLYVQQFAKLPEKLESTTGFYDVPSTTFDEAMQRTAYFKQCIENHDGYKLLYKDTIPVSKEADLQLMYRLVWRASPSSVDREVNNGRGPVDYKISRGSTDMTLIEFKLASNSKLRQNIESQIEVYQAANPGSKKIKVIVYFSNSELEKVQNILNELGLAGEKSIFLIDARIKQSASNVKKLEQG